ncbi:MAG: hypothetical protein EOP08_01490 [Proteobacteria bacterium]|nr:MAG: hypothetical protein EOP08_01490 [Pseudomonadota bacterium]
MNTRIAPLISVAELAASPGGHVLVDCRFDLADPAAGERSYVEGHLPGAIYAHLDRDLSGPVTPTSGRHPLPDPSTFAATLAAAGLEPDARVVVYDQGAGAVAARLWWMLRAVGQRSVQVLDGGLAAWRASGGALEQGFVRRERASARHARAFTGAVSTARSIHHSRAATAPAPWS